MIAVRPRIKLPAVVNRRAGEEKTSPGKVPNMRARTTRYSDSDAARDIIKEIIVRARLTNVESNREHCSLIKNARCDETETDKVSHRILTERNLSRADNLRDRRKKEKKKTKEKLLSQSELRVARS